MPTPSAEPGRILLAGAVAWRWQFRADEDPAAATPFIRYTIKCRTAALKRRWRLAAVWAKMRRGHD